MRLLSFLWRSKRSCHVTGSGGTALWMRRSNKELMAKILSTILLLCYQGPCKCVFDDTHVSNRSWASTKNIVPSSWQEQFPRRFKHSFTMPNASFLWQNSLSWNCCWRCGIFLRWRLQYCFILFLNARETSFSRNWALEASRSYYWTSPMLKTLPCQLHRIGETVYRKLPSKKVRALPWNPVS